MDDNSERVLAARYYKKDEDGKVIETRRELFRRVAEHVASVEEDKEKWAQSFYELMDEGYFLPNTPCLANAGRKDGQLAACYVIGMEDSLESIFNAISLSAKIFKSGGGDGISFNALRPEGAPIGGDNNKVSSGPVSFIKLFDEMVNSVKQGGIRRGAIMGSLSVHHPSISAFINIKKYSMETAERLRKSGVDNETIQTLMAAAGFTNFNLSAQVTDRFMKAVVDNKDYEISHPKWNGGKPSSLNAEEIWGDIAKNAHDSGCPGILFVDRINKDNLLYPDRVIETSNPCLCGDTLVMTVEEGPIPIKQLADDKKDVLVHCCDDRGNPYLRWGRNPRKTGSYNKIFKVTLSDGSYIRVNAKHRFLTRDGKTIKCKNLKTGDSLMPFRMIKGDYETVWGKESHRMVYSDARIGRELSTCETVHMGDDSLNDDPNTLKVIVENIERDGVEDVYNITVDEFHTVAYITRTEKRQTRFVGYRLFYGLQTRQCGETPLLPGEQCCLGSIDLSKFVCNTTDVGMDFDYISFGRVIPECIRFLDDVIDVNVYPTKEIETAAKYTRKIGLGVMGYADTLIKLGLEYGSEKALEFTEKLAKCLQETSISSSKTLYMEKGAALAYHDVEGVDIRRNMMVNVIAPTGSLSMIENCSPGIEPIYDIHYTKNVSIGSFSYEHPEAKKYFEEHNWDWEFYKTKRGFKLKDGGTFTGGHAIQFEKLFAKADEISYEKHIKTQATWQKYLDGSISKTVALPADATPDTFKKAYMLAYELGCKGITAFKACPVKQGVYSRDKDEIKDIEPSDVEDTVKRKRPQRVEGFTEVIPTSQGKMYVTVNSDNSGLSEVFVSIGRSGYESTSKTEAIGRLISLCLRSNIPLENIIKQLSGISCDRPVHSSHGLVRSVPDGVAKVLSTLLNDEVEINKYEDSEQTCPNCFLPLEIPLGGGCPVCQRCGKQCSM